MTESINHIELLLLALLPLVAAFALLAKRIQIPYPIVLVLGGLALSLIPGLPRVELNPDVVFFIILPPLLFSASFHTSWRDFRNNSVSIFMLAFGLVGFTIFGVAVTIPHIVPNFSTKLGLVLGSVIATTDAIAATATAKRLGLPRRLIDILEAESLVNDGSGLVALKFTLAMTLTGITPTLISGVGTLFYLIVAAVAIGLVVGIVVHRVQARIVDSPIEITVSLITPYIAYLAAERAHCSGVMATLACGLYLGRRSSGFYSLHARIESSAVWRTLDFVLNGVVFIMIGLQLPLIISDIRGLSVRTLIVDGAAFSGIVVLLRLLWVYPGAWISFKIQTRLFGSRALQKLSAKPIFLVGWAGMRGVLALAAAISLPERLNNGAPFPQRNLIIFLTFCVIFATLVIQGLTLPTLIRRFGLAGFSIARDEEEFARREAIGAALRRLSQLRSAKVYEPEIYDAVERQYRQRLAFLEETTQEQPSEHRFDSESVLAQQLRDIERDVVLMLRNQNKIHDEVMRKLERELDLRDAQMAEAEEWAE